MLRNSSMINGLVPNTGLLRSKTSVPLSNTANEQDHLNNSSFPLRMKMMRQALRTSVFSCTESVDESCWWHQLQWYQVTATFWSCSRVALCVLYDGIYSIGTNASIAKNEQKQEENDTEQVTCIARTQIQTQILVTSPEDLVETMFQESKLFGLLIDDVTSRLITTFFWSFFTELQLQLALSLTWLRDLELLPVRVTKTQSSHEN